MSHAAESEAVQAFILERQAAVLAEAIRQLSSCTRDELPAVAHAVSGSVGSYQMVDAHQRIADLRGILDDPASTEADVDAAWRATLDDLRALEAGVRP